MFVSTLINANIGLKMKGKHVSDLRAEDGRRVNSLVVRVYETDGDDS